MARPGSRCCCRWPRSSSPSPVLAVKAWPAIRVNGWYFLYGRNWTYGNGYGAVVHTSGVAHPQGAQFGAWAIIWGRSSPPSSPSSSRCRSRSGPPSRLTERLPVWISQPLGFTIEILAGIPSVLIGLWGILTFGPWLAEHVYPDHRQHTLPDVPVVQVLPQPGGAGRGCWPAPRARPHDRPDHHLHHPRPLPQVPPLPKEGAAALGMTDWEVARKVTLPWVRSGIIGATVLGLGRRWARPSPSP